MRSFRVIAVLLTSVFGVGLSQVSIAAEVVKVSPGSASALKVIKVPSKISEVKGGVIAQLIPEKEKFKKGIFWKVERTGFKPSFLLGTMHSSHPDVIALTKVIKDQFKQTTVLCTEIDMGYSMVLEMAKLSPLIYYPEGQSLRKTIGPKLFSEVAKLIKPLGIDVVTLDRMRPWLVNVTLSIPKSNGAPALDMKLALNASGQSKKLCGLEKAKEQFDALAGAPKEYHIRSLRLTVKYFDKVQGMSIKLREMYLSRDLLAMANLVKNSPIPVPKADIEKMMFRLVIRRNIIMVNRMQQYLKKGNVFFAVGALHLPGKGGLLRMLESQGYKLTRLY